MFSFGVTADKGGFLPAMVCRLLTHNGHALRILASYSSRPLTLVEIAVSLASSVLMSRPWEKAPTDIGAKQP
jgi:hypothetical protein